MIVHEAPKTAGVGAEIFAQVVEGAFAYLDVAPLRICGPDTPVPYNRALEALYMPSAERIAQEVKDYLNY